MVFLQKSDCGREMTQEEIRGIQLNMLDQLAEFLRANGLRYYLSGGTLLGAVRHKGYIPWDDDIDINIPRPDCEKLFQLCGGKIGDYVLCRGGEEDIYSKRCFWYRLYNPEVLVESYMGGVSKEPYYMPLYIDIFPIDGFPEGDFATKVFCHRLSLRCKILLVAANDKVVGKTAFRKLIHYIAYVPVHLIGYRFWCRRFLRLAQKYRFDDCNYVGATTIVHYLPREKMEKEPYLRPVAMEFEDRSFDCPGSYDTYLKSLYGSYWELPPEEKRRTEHVFHFYRRITGTEREL
jgi:LPS biosynthesis protein